MFSPFLVSYNKIEIWTELAHQQYEFNYSKKYTDATVKF